ncbi:MAG TPA: DUF5946 family protein [Methanobacteriaceae archaeon]|nr:DUF5946 family protein [Methanobacteriaceae archaeon]
MTKEKSEQELFYELTYYTTVHPDPSFIHQHAVDAFAAQIADENTKPVTITFALVGLYLLIEKNFSGKEVQNAHVKLAKHRKRWPKFNLPKERGNITIRDVISIPPGSKRDEFIFKWCKTVWDAYIESHEKVAYLLCTELWKEKINTDKAVKNLKNY